MSRPRGSTALVTGSKSIVRTVRPASGEGTEGRENSAAAGAGAGDLPSEQVDGSNYTLLARLAAEAKAARVRASERAKRLGIKAAAPTTPAEASKIFEASIASIPVGQELKFLRDTIATSASRKVHYEDGGVMTIRPFLPLLNISFNVEDLASSAELSKATLTKKKLETLKEHIIKPNIDSHLEKLGEKENGHNVRVEGPITFADGLYEALKETYTPEDKIDNIPLYFIVHNPGHISMFVLFGGEIYSLGLGYSESTALERKAEGSARKAAAGSGKLHLPLDIPENWVAGGIHELYSMAALYNLDDVIIGGLDNRKKNGDPYSFPLASIGFFTKGHADRILAVARQNVGVMNITFDSDMPTMFTLFLNKKYSKASNPTIVSLAGTDSFNCTTFLEFVFVDKISCTGSAKGGFVFSHPLACKSYAPPFEKGAKLGTMKARAEDLNKRFKQVMIEYRSNAYSPETFDYLNYSEPPKTWLGTFTFGLFGGKKSKGGNRSHKTRKNRRIAK